MRGAISHARIIGRPVMPLSDGFNTQPPPAEHAPEFDRRDDEVSRSHNAPLSLDCLIREGTCVRNAVDLPRLENIRWLTVEQN